MRSHSGQLYIQCDWEDALRHQGSKAWISFKKPGQPGVHGELECKGLSQEGAPYISASKGFSVDSVSRKKLRVSFAAQNVTTTFQAPQIGFTSIHKPKKNVTCLDVTPGGLGVSCDATGNLHVWQTDTGEVRRELSGHVGDIYTCRFFPSGVVVLAGGADMRVGVYCVKTGQRAANLAGHTMAVTDSAIIERGRNVVSCSRDGSARLWNVSTSGTLATLTPEDGPLNCCWLGAGNAQSTGTPEEGEVGTEGKVLLLGSEGGRVTAYDLVSRQQVLSYQAGTAVSAGCMGDDHTALVGTQDGRVVGLDLRKPAEPVHVWTHSQSPVLSLLALPTGFLTTRGDGSCSLQEVNNGGSTVEFSGPDCDPVYCARSDDSCLFTACRDGVIRRYPLPSSL